MGLHIFACLLNTPKQNKSIKVCFFYTLFTLLLIDLLGLSQWIDLQIDQLGVIWL